MGKIRRGLRKVRRCLKPGGVILLYHRIARLSDDPHSMAVAPEHFAQHLEVIRQSWNPMRLLDLSQALRKGLLPRRAVALTFDDAYVDFLTDAYPLLRSAQIPATLFVVSGQVNGSREYWWDELERILLFSTDLPSDLRIGVRGRELCLATASADQRRAAYQTLCDYLRPLTTADRRTVLAGLANWAGTEDGAGRPGYHTMTAAELTKVTGEGLVEIGAHTVSHPHLASLPSHDAQAAEIYGSREALESMVGRPVRAFAYPYGTARDFGDRAVEIVRRAGFDAACTAIAGSVEPGDDPFRLRRCWVHDWDLAMFERQLEWFHLIRHA